ncbi:NAD(P)-dependent oxidoreductase [Blastococcus xanthinilyticus]|uniref:Phosphoglycerate dehydrogenase-like enzyme n=1 Tax=Blastococcus xanthinilyticus TaxID=1564164 RepID=A0A5S5CQK5_9ACTN|nr:NAD(P)-dependent oxidoreductase [Blastococcus xanthinilyticus]TYP84625.1 phosphoglycerate dehydrogenase-like enzyme [Blastococcus xanthinilyticus]
MSEPADAGVPVWVGPRPDPVIADGVRRGGGRLTGSDEAEAVVWLDRGPTGLGEHLHPGVRWVQLALSGVDSWVGHPVMRSAAEFTAVRGIYAPQVAEHALALLLAGARELARAARSTSWDRPDTRLLSGATVVIVGAGAIGRELIRFLEPFRCRIVAVNRSGAPVDGAAETLPVARLDEACAVGDYLVLAAPATPATRSMIGAHQLARMPRHGWIVNVGRGSLVDTAALTAALSEGTVRGAALDVTDPEPLPPDHPLWREPGCVITSHSANPADARLSALADRVAENVARFARGEPLLGSIDPESGF